MSPACCSCNCLHALLIHPDSAEGLVKPDIVFFGESLPPRFFQKMQTDFPKADLLIVMGTSLTVHPFASLIGEPVCTYSTCPCMQHPPLNPKPLPPPPTPPPPPPCNRLHCNSLHANPACTLTYTPPNENCMHFPMHSLHDRTGLCAVWSCAGRLMNLSCGSGDTTRYLMI